MAFVFKEEDKVCTYLFGLDSQTQLVAYAHLIAVRNNYRRLCLGRKFYKHFINCAREKYCSQIKVIKKSTNFQSIVFHKSSGMKLTVDGFIDGVPVVLDYNGPGVPGFFHEGHLRFYRKYPAHFILIL